MILATTLFIITYLLMLTLPKYRSKVVLLSASLFIVLGYAGFFPLDFPSALRAVDYNVLLMIGGTMGIVTLFIESKMPLRLAEILITKVPNIQLAVTALALFAGVISAFVDNVATVFDVGIGVVLFTGYDGHVPVEFFGVINVFHRLLTQFLHLEFGCGFCKALEVALIFVTVGFQRSS